MSKIARPIKEINKRQFETMCKLQHTQKEICLILDITDKTLTKWCKKTYDKSFSQVFEQKREMGKMSLRRTQWSMAQYNPAMAIFLGKNYLNQSDKKGIEESPLDIKIKEKQLEKLDAETQLLKTKIETLTNGGNAQEIINALLAMQNLLNSPIENRNINEMLVSDEKTLVNDENVLPDNK